MREMRHLIFNKRFRKIFFMFMGFFLQFWWQGKTKKFYRKEKIKKRNSIIYTAQAKKFTQTAVELGGLIIKLGQFVSSRVDILPKEYTDHLSELQDSVSPVESEIIVKRIEEELTGTIYELFETFEKVPVAAASLGQVHKAILKNGDSVAVKVMRPRIEEIVLLDLSTFKVLIAFAKRFTNVSKFVDLEDVYKEFQEVITDELDYQKEAQHIEIFREQFLDFPAVSVPKVYGDHSTSKVLVMEFIEGVKINEVDKLKEWKINRKKLAATLYLTYIKQIMEEGFFHADPHPGNLLVKKDGTLAFIDFGMVGRISGKMKENMVKLAMAIYLKDVGGIVKAFENLGFLRKNADKAGLKKSIKLVLTGFSNNGFKIESIQEDEFLEDMREFLYQQPFQIPSGTTFLGKAVMTIFSICKGLDEKFDVIGLTKPYVNELMISDTNSSTKETVIDLLKDTFMNMIPTVQKVGRIIDQFDQEDLRVTPSKAFERKLLEQQSRHTKRIIWAIFGAALFISGPQTLEQNTMLGMGLMAVGGIMVLIQALRVDQGTRRFRRRHPHFRREV